MAAAQTAPKTAKKQRQRIDTAQSNPQNRANFVRSLMRQAGGVVFSSATCATSPNHPYAARTGMRYAVEDPFSVTDVV